MSNLDSPQIPIKSLWVHLHMEKVRRTYKIVFFTKKWPTHARLMINDCGVKNYKASMLNGNIHKSDKN